MYEAMSRVRLEVETTHHATTSVFLSKYGPQTIDKPRSGTRYWQNELHRSCSYCFCPCKWKLLVLFGLLRYPQNWLSNNDYGLIHMNFVSFASCNSMLYWYNNQLGIDFTATFIFKADFYFVPTHTNLLLMSYKENQSMYRYISRGQYVGVTCFHSLKQFWRFRFSVIVVYNIKY